MCRAGQAERKDPRSVLEAYVSAWNHHDSAGIDRLIALDGPYGPANDVPLSGPEALPTAAMEEIECDCERMRVHSKAVHWACNDNPEVTVISRRLRSRRVNEFIGSFTTYQDDLAFTGREVR